MQHASLFRRLFCLLLAAALLTTLLVPASAAGSGREASAEPAEVVSETVEGEEHALSDLVRVSILLEEPSTFDAGYNLDSAAADPAAISYRDGLKAAQAELQARIEAALGNSIAVKHNLTLLMNVISADVRYGDIARIKAVPGVRDVELEARYDPPETVESDPAEPNTAITSTYLVGAAETWAEGYTGAGSRVAIIDTGLDTDHQSFDADAFRYAIQQTGKTVSLFTQSDLNAIKSQLNGSSAVYVSEKIPFGYNYVDENTTINHLSDTAGDHGSHVAGIAAANRFLKSGSSYVDAASSVGAVGMAPDAQVFIMKVFGSAGGAYESDYMVAIEDAIVLGCDAVNLSLGSGMPGFTHSSTSTYQAIMTKLANAGINTKLVVSISAGNSGALTDNLTTDLYIEDVFMHTGGNPGTFINSLCVASADNIGVIGKPLRFNDSQRVFYNESSNSGGKLADHAGSYSFVYIDAIGSADDYAAVNAAVSLSGKIVIVNRGEITFVDKGNNLISYNPAALIVANNIDGLVSMALDDYTGSFPMVSISLADAQTIKADSAAHTVGSYTYYTGTVTVTDTTMSELTSDNAEMSAFSSWGVPGSLIMKPEITAPGGSIYSVYGTSNTSSGTTGGTDQYIIKSGTSMAAPHIAGLTGTLAQYLRENNISISGKTSRQIIQSLLMSTAVPMHEGSAEGAYYPILRQGAGLANVHQAVHASSVLFMNSDATISYADGKVKAELGDKPSKSGAYTWSFTIYNTANKAQTYSLSTDLFTQDRYVGSDGYAHMSASTTALNWPVTYSTGNTVTVPAGGSQSVTVNISIPADMSAFDALYPKGAYVEGYTFVESQTTSRDGALLDVRHSIPILGFYGSWTDPSMFDNMSYVDETVYEETRVPYTGVTNTNYMTYTRSGSTRYVTGNPYITESPFPGDRLALRSTDTIYQIKYSLVRSAGTTGLGVSRIDDAGNVTEVLNASVSSTKVYGLYYSESASALQNTSAKTVTVSKTLSSYGVSDGDRVRVGFYAIPEYNAMKVNTDVNAYSAGYLSSTTFPNVLRSNVLGKGAMVGYDFYVDDTAPTILSAVRSGSAVTVTVQDDNYIAKVALMNGSTTIEQLIPPQTEKGQAVTCTFNISGLSNTSNLRVFAGDYASNETTQAPEELLYTITAASNNTALGTVSVVGSAILAEPAEGCYLESVQVISGSANPVISGNTVTVNPTSNCSILVIFAAKPIYTITYQANGVTEGSVTAYVNDVITLPGSIANTDVAEDYSFIGWYTANLPETTDMPAFFAPGASYTVTADATFLALFKRVEGNDGEIYRLLTEAPADWTGSYVISSGTTGSDYIMINTTGVYYRNPDACTTISGGGITVADDALLDVLPSQVFAVTPASTSGYYRIMMNSIDGTYVADSGSGLCSTTNAEGSLNIWSLTAGTGGRFLIATQQWDNYMIGLDTSYNAFDSIRNGSGVYLWKGEPAGIAYYTTNPLTDSHDHELEYHAAVAPTCTEPGSSAYYRCTLCGKCYADAACENEIAIADTVIAALGHNYVGVVTPPTETQQGYTIYTCSRCGDSFMDDFTDPLGSDFPVHFSVPAGVTKPADMVSNSNTGITLPTVAGPEGYTFLGWVLEDYNNVAVRPASILTGSYVAPHEITLKALFTYTEGGSGEVSYPRVTAAPGDWSGRYVITYGKENTLYAMTGVTAGDNMESSASATTFANSGMTLANDTLTGVPQSLIFELIAKGSHYALYSADKNAYVQNSGGTLRSTAAYDASTCDWDLTIDQYGNVTIKNTNVTSYPNIGFSSSGKYFWAIGSTNATLYLWAETASGTPYWTTVIGEAHVHTPGSPVTENNVPATCTAAGSYDNVVYCTECGEELSRETVTVPALGHDYVAVVTPPTATEQGYTTHTCSRCGDTYVDSYTDPTGPAEPIETTDLHIYSSITVGTDMVVTLTARKTDLTSYSKFWIEVVKHAPDGDVTYCYGAEQAEALDEGAASWRADFRHIYAKEMGVEIEARLWAEDAAGQTWMSPALTTNIRDYLGGRLTATNNKESQRVLAADMLNYGAAAQLFMEYDTEHLVNQELTAAQLAKLHQYETATLPTVAKTNTNTTPAGQSLILYNSVTLGNEVLLTLAVRAAADADVKVLVKDHTTGNVLYTLDTVYSGSSHKVDFNGIGADKMRVEYDFVAQVNGTETGNIRTWSIEGYVGEIRAGSNQLKTDLANALLTYGDAAAAYFAAQ